MLRVAVIGGGPSGSCAAEILAKAGIKTWLFERKLDNAKPCGGAIPLCMVEEFDLPESIIDRKVRHMRMISPSNREVDISLDRVYGKSDNEFIGMCRREVMDAFMRNRASDLGATLSLVSTTKFINGHSDALGGAVLTNNEVWNSKMLFSQKALGLQPSPFDSWLITRGLKTLPLRIEQQTQSAKLISEELENHKIISKVIYPFNQKHPQFNLAKSLMRSGGSMITIKLNLKKEDTFKFCKSLKYISLAESLGGVESLICHPATMTHASFDDRTKHLLGIDDALVRLSIGCEDTNDLISDILFALNKF